MKNNKNDFIVMLKEAAILFAITLIAGLLLGYIYDLTKNPIEIAKKNAIDKACKEVFTGADSFEEIAFELSPELLNEASEVGVSVDTVYVAKASDKTDLGSVIKVTTNQGYGGNIVLFVGVNGQGILNGISILEISETAGLGMEAGNVLVPQFANKEAQEFVYVKTGATSPNEIDAISGATITTRAVTNAVNTAIKAATELSIGGAENE